MSVCDAFVWMLMTVVVTSLLAAACLCGRYRNAHYDLHWAFADKMYYRKKFREASALFRHVAQVVAEAVLSDSDASGQESDQSDHESGTDQSNQSDHESDDDDQSDQSDHESDDADLNHRKESALRYLIGLLHTKANDPVLQDKKNVLLNVLHQYLSAEHPDDPWITTAWVQQWMKASPNKSMTFLVHHLIEELPDKQVSDLIKTYFDDHMERVIARLKTGDRSDADSKDSVEPEEPDQPAQNDVPVEQAAAVAPAEPNLE